MCLFLLLLVLNTLAYSQVMKLRAEKVNVKSSLPSFLNLSVGLSILSNFHLHNCLLNFVFNRMTVMCSQSYEASH